MSGFCEWEGAWRRLRDDASSKRFPRAGRSFLLLRSRRREGSASDTLDIGRGVRTTILEAAELIATRAGAPRPKVSGRFRDGDVRAAQADVTRSRDILGYEPATSFATGIEDLLAWMPTTGLV